MKKLIVLFGPENSGKTTTLKIAYELTKQDNTEETKWFKYYDDQKAHNDFRDVLILDRSNTNNDKHGDFLINEDNQDEVIKKMVSFIRNTIICDDEIKDKEEEVKKIKWNEWDNLKDFKKKVMTFTMDEEERPNNLYDFKDKYKVAYVLEGDYGFIHHDNKGSYPKLNLYTHLKNVELCDTIVCACSVVKKSGYQYQPLSCLIYFILKYLLTYKSIQVYMIYNGASIKRTRRFDPTVWPRRNNRNQKNGQFIYSLI